MADTRDIIAFPIILESSAVMSAPPEFVRILETGGIVLICLEDKCRCLCRKNVNRARKMYKNLQILKDIRMHHDCIE